MGLRYWGLAFDVHAVRGIRVRALDFVARVAGAQRVWIYVRSRKQCGAGKDCSLWGHELSANAWELVGPNATVGQEVTVDASLLATVEVGEIALAAGETRGFLLVGSLGVAYATVGDGGRTCDAGFLQRCTLFSDSFAEIYPGKLVLTQALIPAPAPNVLLAAEGNERSPFFYTGTVHYDNDEIVGATYVCRFETTSSDGTVNVAESLPTRAFTAALTDLNVATNFSCIVPAWPFNEAVTNFSVVSTGSPVWFGAAITGSVDRTMTNFRFSAIYTALASHMWATAAGGDNIGITGAGFQTATAAYECEFSALDGSHSASTLVVVANTSFMSCKTPEWLASFADTVLSIKRVADGTALDWGPDDETQIFAVGSAGGTVCLGAACATGAGDGPACLSYPCELRYRRLIADQTERKFKFVDVVEGITPSIGKASGGTRIDVSGGGFDASSAYMCVFARQAEELAFEANVGSDTSLSCITPVNESAWGYLYTGISSNEELSDSTANLRVYRTIDASGLLRSDVSVDGASLKAGFLWRGQSSTIRARVGGEFLALTAPSLDVADNSTTFVVVERGHLGF